MPRRTASRAVAVAVGLALLVVVAGCGGSDTRGSRGCGPVRREPLDPRSVHLLPGAADPGYRTDPPTSGPHLPSPSTQAVRTDPISAPVQVGLLEEGGVVLQFRALSSTDRAALEGLAGDGITVAPAGGSDGPEVIATAWVTKQECEELDLGALRRFADDHLDRGPDDHA